MNEVFHLLPPKVFREAEKTHVKGRELVFFRLPEGGWGCGIITGFVRPDKIVASFGDCEATVPAADCVKACPADFLPEAGYLVGQRFKDENAIGEKLLPLLKRKGY